MINYHLTSKIPPLPIMSCYELRCELALCNRLASEMELHKTRIQEKSIRLKQYRETLAEKLYDLIRLDHIPFPDFPHNPLQDGTHLNMGHEFVMPQIARFIWKTVVFGLGAICPMTLMWGMFKTVSFIHKRWLKVGIWYHSCKLKNKETVFIKAVKRYVNRYYTYQLINEEEPNIESLSPKSQAYIFELIGDEIIL